MRPYLLGGPLWAWPLEAPGIQKWSGAPSGLSATFYRVPGASGLCLAPWCVVWPGKLPHVLPSTCTQEHSSSWSGPESTAQAQGRGWGVCLCFLIGPSLLVPPLAHFTLRRSAGQQDARASEAHVTGKSLMGCFHGPENWEKWVKLCYRFS